MQAIAEGWLVLELTHSPFAVGLTATLATLPILLFTLYGGVVADRVDKRRFIMILQTIMLLQATTLAVLTLTDQITVHWIWALAAIFGTAVAFEVPARQAMLVELIPPDALISAAALNSTAYNLARVAGPAVAGLLVAAAGPGVAFAVNALSYIAVLEGLRRMEYRGTARPQAERPSVWTGVRFIRSRPLLEAMTWQMMLSTIFAGAFIAILSVYARDVLRTGPAGYGLLMAAIGVGAAIGAIAMGAVGSRFHRGHVTAVGAVVLGVAVTLLALTWSLPIAVVLLAIGGAAMAAQGISTATGLQLAAPDEVRGRVMAVYAFVVLGLSPIGAFQAGWIAERIGAGWAIGLNGAVSLAGAIWLWRRLWQTEEAAC